MKYASSFFAPLLLSLGCLMTSLAAADNAGVQGNLASVAWLRSKLAQPDFVLVDASPASVYLKQHIPGAIHSSLFAFGPKDLPLEPFEAQLRSWGLNPGQQILLYDQGGTYMATRLFWDLVHRGVPAQNILILDGGLSKWLAEAGPVTQDATAKPRAGTVRLTALNHDVRVRLPEFLVATADPHHKVMLEALEPSYFFGGAAFFNRGGHVPHATLMPSSDFYNEDKTFKSAAEIQRMLNHLGVRPEQEVLTYCGGGGAAAVPFFALKYLLNYPKVRLFQESQMGWLQDERELPVWTYAAPHLSRDTSWLKAFGSPMLKAFGLSQVSILDLRPADSFKLGHLPLALNLPAQTLIKGMNEPEKLAALLAETGVDPSHEAVLVSEGGLNESSAMAYLMLDRLGQHKVSIFMDSIERWAELGQDVVRPSAVAAADKAKQPGSPPAKAYSAALRPSRLVSAAAPSPSPSLFPRVYIASGQRLPTQPPAGRILHLPYAEFLDKDGAPKPAKDIWNILSKAGVPRYAEIVLVADTLGESAVNYVVFKLMGFADVKVWAP